MGIDLNALLGSLDENSLQALKTAIDLLSTSKKEEEVVQPSKPLIERTEVDIAEGIDGHIDGTETGKTPKELIAESGKITKTSEMKPHYYYETIKPEDWEPFGNMMIHKRELYTKEYAMRESCILSICIDEEKMLNGLTGAMAENIKNFIEMIYDKGMIGIKSGNVECTFNWISKTRPKYDISVIVEELPFPDCPASSMGLA